jgi:hypothetical protein
MAIFEFHYFRWSKSMSERGMLFVEEWLSNNIQAAGYGPSDDQSQAAKYADDCLAAAERKGITKNEIEEDYGDLVDHMSGAIEDANDAEAIELAKKN